MSGEVDMWKICIWGFIEWVASLVWITVCDVLERKRKK